MTKKKKVQIFKLEERVLFEGAAAADIVAAVDNAGAADHADQADSDSAEKEDQFVQNTVRNAGPAEAPSADSNVRNSGEGLPQADSASADPADALIEGSAGFPQLTDPETSFSGEVADFLSADMSDASGSGLAAGALTEAEKTELVILDKDAAAELDPAELEGKNVLVLDGESAAADQVENWLNEHDGESFDSVKLVSDSMDADDIGDIQGHLTENAQVENISLADFRAELSGADQDMVIFPDSDANISVDGAPLTETDTVPGELLEDAAEERNELVIVNSTTADLDNVLDQLGDSRDVLVLDANSQDSAMEQISAYLEAHSDKQYDAVHILTHGNDSGLILGSDYVTEASAFEIFRGHIADNGDMMIYGCETAATDAGQSFLQGIADATGADVAASTNLTGAAALGGDWTLEYSTGTIETTSISLDSSWNHAFEIYTVGEGKTYTRIGDLGTLLNGSDVQIVLSSNIKEVKSITVDGNVFVHTNDKGDYKWDMGGHTLTVSNGASLTVEVSNVDLSNAASVDVAGSLTLQNSGTSSHSSNINVNLLDHGKLALQKNVTLSNVTATGNSNTLNMDSTSVIETFTLNGGNLEFTAGTINTLTNDSGAAAAGKGAAFGAVINSGVFTLDGGRADSISSSDNLTVISGFVDTVVVSGGSLTISGGSINTVENSGTAAFNGGTVTNFGNTVTGTLNLSGSAAVAERLTNDGVLTITGGNVEALTNTGANATISGGKVNAITNSGSNLAVSGGSIGDVMNEASGSIDASGGTFGMITNFGDLHFTGDTTTGMILNEKTLTVDGGVTLTIKTLDGAKAIENKAGGTINLDGTLLNGNTEKTGTGIRNTDGGTINGTGEISGFTYAAEVLTGESLVGITTTNNLRALLVSLTVTGKTVTAAGEYTTINDAQDFVAGTTANDYSVNIKLDLNDYENWNTFLTVSGDRTLDNLFSINSNTKTNSGENVQLTLVLDGTMTLAMPTSRNGGFIAFDNISLHINNSAALTVNAGSTLKISGTYSVIESVSGLGTAFVVARVKDGAAQLTNYGTMTVNGSFKADYLGLKTDVSAITNYGTLIFNAGSSFEMTAAITSVRPAVTGITNMTNGTFTADTAKLSMNVSGRAATSVLFSNAGTASFTDSTASVKASGSAQTYGLFNNGKLTLTDSSVDASGGSEAYGLFNGSSGEAKFIVTKLPPPITETPGMTYTDYLNQLYHIKGSTYSVYNENIFSTENKVVSGSGYTADKGLLTGTVNGMDFRDAPLFALIGDVHTQGRADSSGRTTTVLSDVTVDGKVSSYGNALVDMKNLRLNGDVINQLSTILFSGDFMTSDFYFGSTHASYGNAIRIVNDFSASTTGSNVGGSIYFGTDQTGTNTRVNFSSTGDYAFYNLTGTMAIANFSNLSSEKNPVQIFNFGVFTLDATNADKGTSKYYTLYVKEAAESSNLMDFYGGHYATADGIRDRGILNMNINGHNSASPIQNGMTLTGLDIRNTLNYSAAVTNYAGKLTINGGKLSATYSALDNLEVILPYGNGGSLSEVYVVTSVAELNGVERIAGSAYSVRNTGKLTIRGTDDTATLFTNELDFSSNYIGDYTAVVNSSVSVYMQEFDSGTNDVPTIDWIYWRSAFTNMVIKITNVSSSAVLPGVKLYQMTADSITARTQVDLPLDYTYTVPNTSDVWRGYGNALVEAAAVLHNVSFSAKSSPDTQMVFLNWGSLTVTGIKDAGNQFRDFDFLINNSSSSLNGYSFWASSDRRIHSGSVPSTSYQHKTNADITVGFDVAASHIARNYGELTMRGELANPDSSPLDYNGRFIADGSSLTVITSSKLRLVNFSVIGTNTPYAIQVEAGGQLGIYNGTYDSANNEWKGGSNAYITAAGGTAILNQGYVEMINGAITGSVNGIESTDMAGKLAIVNSTIAGNSGWGIISSIADPGSEYWNFLVANSTIAYNEAGGIWLKAGKLSLINSIVLNSIDGKNDILVNGNGTIDNNGGNIYGPGTASDGQSKLMNTFGSPSLVWNDTYHVISVLANADARTMSVAWSYDAPDSGFFVLGHIWYNSATAGKYQIHYDQLGNARETSGSVIGAYVAEGSPTPPAISVIVNTFKEDSNPNNNVWSLREVIEYLQSDKNTSGAYEVAFDWDALLAEESDVSKWVFLLDNTGGALKFDGNNVAGITGIVINGFYNGNTNMITVSGDNLSDSVFVVDGMDLTLSNLTVDGAGTAGTSVNVNGAAVRLEGTANTSLTVDGNVSFTGGNTTADGGAIYVGAGAVLTMTGTGNVISGNTANNGGGIYNLGTATVSGTEIRGNKAVGNGGGIYNSGTLTVDGNIENNAAAAGGALYMAGGSLSVNGTITGNTANDGGALYMAGGSLSVNGTITGNTANDGGAIYMTGGDLSVDGTITGNTANDGGAIYMTGGDLSVGGSITNNTASSGAVVHLADGNATIGSLDSHVAILGNSGSLVYQTGGDLQLINAQIRKNGTAADSGMSLFDAAGGTLSVLNSTVTENFGDSLNVLKMSGSATVNLGDATLAFNGNGKNAAMQLTGGTLNVVNSIVDHTGSLSAVTLNQVASLLNEDVTQIFAMDEYGTPRDGKNGTLKISFSGLAGKGGVMTGFARTVSGTQLFYQTASGGSWYDVSGNEISGTVTVIDRGQNDVVRDYNGYGQLSIGAFSLGSMNNQSLVVTISGDKMDEYDGETSLREALEYADYLYSTTGVVQTVTFKPGLGYVEADQTFTVSSSVNISGSVTVQPGAGFAGSSIFTVKGDSTLTVNGLTVDGDGKARGFEVINSNLNLNGTVVRDGIAGQGGGVYATNSNITVNGGAFSGNTAAAEGGAVYLNGGALNASGTSFDSNSAVDGAAIYSLGGLVGLSNVGVSGNQASAGAVITAAGTGVYMNESTFIGNKAGTNLVDAGGKITALTVTTADNTTGSSLFKGTAADIVNSSITGTAGDGSALVSVPGLAQVANSVIVGDGMADSVSAGEVYAAYSIFGNQPGNLSVNDGNVFGQTRGSVFNGLVNGKLTTAKNSPASTGVWTTYDAASGEINYTTRPDSVWTEGYNPNRMTWNYLGPGNRPGRYIASNLVGSAEMSPSIGAFWGNSVKPDFGPGVNAGMVDPSYSGLFSTDWSSYVLANGILIDPGFYLTFATDSELGWYDDLYRQLFGRRYTDLDSFSVITGRGDVGQTPSGENDIDLSVKGMVEDDFSEFIEAPYHAEDGVPLTEEELNQIRNAAVTGERPEDSLNLSETVHQKVASALRSADLFKDSFDKALDTLLGLDA